MHSFKTNKKYFFCAVGYLLSIVFIFVIWYNLQFEKILDEKKQIPFLIALITIVLVIFLSIVQNSFILTGKQMHPQTYFALGMIVWGCIYMLVLPPFSAPDEITHFASSNKLANSIMNQTTVDEQQRVYVREIDKKVYTKELTEESVREFYMGITEPAASEVIYEVMECEGATGTRTFFLNYLPQSIGIVVARLLNCNYLFLTFMGRLFNLLCYTVIVYWAIKVIPFGKWTIYIITQFPMMLELVASYSYDAIATALAFLFIAYCMYLIYEKPIVSNKNLIYLLILGMLMSPIKAVYGVITLLVCLIPKDKITSTKKYMHLLYKGGIIFLSFISVVAVNMSTVKRTISSSVAPTEVEKTISSEITYGKEVNEVQPYYSLRKVLSEQGLLMELSRNTLEERGWFYVKTMVGGHLSWLSIKIHVSIVILFLLLLISSMIIHPKEKNYIITKGHRVCGLVIVFLCFAIFHAIMLVSWTREGEMAIQGVQGRYFIPALPILLVVCYIKKARKSIEVQPIMWMYACNLLNLFTILQVFTAIYTH